MDYKRPCKKEGEFKILDLGTGSGCISVSLARFLKKSKVYAVDLSNKALDQARENAKLNNEDVTFEVCDILDKNLPNHFKNFEVFVSNPPYVRNLEKKGDEAECNALRTSYGIVCAK